jgi:phenylpyruvate tautomerase
MPYLKIITSQSANAQKQHHLLAAASRLVAHELQKPEQYMMVSIDTAAPMMFAGSAEPCAFLDLRSIGLPQAKTAKLSQLLCQLVETELGVNKNRVYINFTDIPRTHWGWNGETF